MRRNLEPEGIVIANILPLTSTYQIDEDDSEDYVKWLSSSYRFRSPQLFIFFPALSSGVAVSARINLLKKRLFMRKHYSLC